MARGPHGHPRRPLLLRLGQGRCSCGSSTASSRGRRTGWTASRRCGWRSVRGARRRGATRTRWPLPATRWRELHLGDGTLSWEATAPGSTAFPASFETAPSDGSLELTGPVALRLWVTAETDDLDVFARLQHVGADGAAIPAVGPQGGPMPMGLGWLRASHRELDRERSLPYRPVHAHRRALPLVPGEPTLLEVEIWPTSITLARGEWLRLELVDADDDLAPLTHDRSPALRGGDPPRRRARLAPAGARHPGPRRRSSR